MLTIVFYRTFGRGQGWRGYRWEEQEDPTPARRLGGVTLATIMNTRLLTQCAERCLRHARCSSYNFYQKEATCELNSASHLDGIPLVPDVTSVYVTNSALTINKVRELPTRGVFMFAKMVGKNILVLVYDCQSTARGFHSSSVHIFVFLLFFRRN